MKNLAISIFFFSMSLDAFGRPDLPLLVEHASLSSRCASMAHILNSYRGNKLKKDKFVQSKIKNNKGRTYSVQWDLDKDDPGIEKTYVELLKKAEKILKGSFSDDILEGYEFVGSYKMIKSDLNPGDTWFFEFLVHNSAQFMGAGSPPTVVLPIGRAGNFLGKIN